MAAGLDQVQLLPVGRGYAQAMVGATSAGGPFARGELGYHPLDPLSLFGFGQVDQAGWMAGAGARWSF